MTEDRTYKFIMKFLDPYLWGYNPGWEEMMGMSGVDYSEVKNIIRQMRYEEFLQTSYWKAVREKVMEESDGKCDICGDEATDVHHTTYENHGREHDHLEDLISVCSSCHSDLHDRR